MKRAIASLTILILFIQPLYGLAPTEKDWASAKLDDVISVAPLLAKLQTPGPREEASRIREEVKDRLRAIDAVPYFETLTFNRDGSFEIAIRYVDKERRSHLVINRFTRAGDGAYLVAIASREPSDVNNRIARGVLGLDLTRIVGAPVPEGVEQVGLPQALENRRRLMGEVPPEAGRLAYLYAVTDEEPVSEVRRVIADVRAKRPDVPIRAVVVLGMGGQSLGNRAVVQMLGSQEVRFVFPDNIANPSAWMRELEGINPREVLLYASSKTGGTDETMTNFWFFWEWMIRSIGPEGVAESLIGKLQGVNLSATNLRGLSLSAEERGLLETALNRIAVSTTPEKQGSIFNFAQNNNVPQVPLQGPVEGRYTVLFRSGQFTTALAGHDIEAMRQAVLPLAGAFKEDEPKSNPALEAAMYAHRLGRPVLAGVSVDKRLAPLFEWTRQLVNESLGKEEKGPYLTFATGNEASQDLMKAPKNKLFLVINVGEERLEIPEGVSAIVINIAELNPENLARVFLFLEEFTVRYGTFLGVNPVNQPWVDRFKEILTETAGRFDTSPEAREARQAEAGAAKELAVTRGVAVPEVLGTLLSRLTAVDQPLSLPVKVPKDESEFQGLLGIGQYKQPGELEGLAQKLAIQLYTAGRLGKSINPFFIYSASPSARRLGEFIRYLARRRTARLAELGGGVLWDYLVGTTDQHSTAQYLGAGSDIAVTTFLHFLQEPEANPPVVRANGLIHERLEGKTPHEINTLYLEAVRQALSNEGRVTNTIEVPNEEAENLGKLYQLLVRASELYARLVEHEGGEGTTLGKLVEENVSVVIRPPEGVSAGGYGEESPREAVDVYRAVVPMQIGGVRTKNFVNPQPRLSGEVSSALRRFLDRVSVLAGTINRIAARKGSALNQLVTAGELKEKAKREVYAFRLEDAIAKVEVGTEVGDLWEEIRLTAANTMIAKTIQEIRRVNPEARVVVYSKGLSESRIEAVLDMIDSAGVFDRVVKGDSREVLSKVVSEGWARDRQEAMERTVFASVDRVEKLKSVILPVDKFIPFPELATVMQAILRAADDEGKLPADIIDTIVSSYEVWLELAGFSRDEMRGYLKTLQESLESGVGFSVSLPIPPAPKPGSVIKQLDDEYEEATKTKGYA